MRDGLDQAHIHAERVLDQLLAIAGDGAARDGDAA